ncbi:hypothetical protein chiPu_0012354 [Chiloscyllium punctatum]|uniref:Uncharacterized protein n=1 Tax=Chiloscyllium punctatum TaxID=137246 RepID=A0A401SU44_CHIPU|nr:hypothetical protein [Chiloscyllium punctatum]
MPTSARPRRLLPPLGLGLSLDPNLLQLPPAAAFRPGKRLPAKRRRSYRGWSARGAAAAGASGPGRVGSGLDGGGRSVLSGGARGQQQHGTGHRVRGTGREG